MREHNKAQVQAAAAGRKTEAQFGKMRMGAANVAVAFSAIGEAIGGTGWEQCMGRTRQPSQTAFAKGGHRWVPVMAGIGSLIKGIGSLFGRAKRKREEAARRLLR